MGSGILIEIGDQNSSVKKRHSYEALSKYDEIRMISLQLKLEDVSQRIQTLLEKRRNFIKLDQVVGVAELKEKI